MQSFKEIPYEDIKKIKYILCDIDDTITTDGKVSAQAYNAMWHLYEAGYQVIPVTGRPAGWCDLIIRQWPVKAVIGENGAFVYYNEDGKPKTFTHPSVADSNVRERLHKVEKAVLKGVPGCKVSKDQFSRIYDLAIDFNEDVPNLGLDAAKKIKDICESMGATAKISSIHVNAWFGNYNKLDMTRMFMKEVLGEQDLQDSILFFGDSPNDEPMFNYFKNSCAVANINEFLNQLKHLPSYVTTQCSGKGFAEAIDQLLQALSKLA